MAELPYVWGYPLLQINPEVREDARFFFDIIDWTLEEDIDYAEFIITAWANFAKTGWVIHIAMGWLLAFSWFHPSSLDHIILRRLW